MKGPAWVVLFAAALALSACTAQAARTAPTPAPVSTASPARGTGTVSQDELALSYRLEGGGAFVQGSREVCNLSSGDAILIEDEKEIATYDGTKPFSSMALGVGKIQYTTAWPNDEVGTGLTGGSGTYVVNADSSGKPVSITGQATVIFHDKVTNSDTNKPDSVTLTITEIPRPDYCPAGG